MGIFRIVVGGGTNSVSEVFIWKPPKMFGTYGAKLFLGIVLIHELE